MFKNTEVSTPIENIAQGLFNSIVYLVEGIVWLDNCKTKADAIKIKSNYRDMMSPEEKAAKISPGKTWHEFSENNPSDDI